MSDSGLFQYKDNIFIITGYFMFLLYIKILAHVNTGTYFYIKNQPHVAVARSDKSGKETKKQITSFKCVYFHDALWV